MLGPPVTGMPLVGGESAQACTPIWGVRVGVGDGGVADGPAGVATGDPRSARMTAAATRATASAAVMATQGHRRRRGRGYLYVSCVLVELSAPVTAGAGVSPPAASSRAAA